MSTETTRIVLTGEEALKKFLAGKEVWNDYVDQHPEADVNFSGVDFSEYRANGERFIFAQYLFPKKGDVNFNHAQFGEGDVHFSNTQFGEGGVYFLNTQFGKGNVSFCNTQFGEGNVSFCNTQFGEGSVTFGRAQFGKGRVNFDGTQFGEGGIFFHNTQFGAGYVSFLNTQFGEGRVSFHIAQFGEGLVDFSGAQFGEGLIDFSGAQFGEGSVEFNKIEFKGHVSFNELTIPKSITSFSLRNCTFHKTLDISNNNFHCVPDLTNTKLTNQLSLDRMTCQPTVNEDGEFDPKDTERLCRLKELAESNKSHHEALDFHAQEMRVKRQQLSGFDYGLDWAFDNVSEYGLSIKRPICTLAYLTTIFSIIYSLISFYKVVPSTLSDGAIVLGNGFLYSLSQIFPFLSSGKISATESAQALFHSKDIDNWIYAMGLSQGLLSFVLLFLIGLGLRHRFRL